MKSDRKTVKKLLKDTKNILSSDSFNIETDYVLICSQKEKIEFSTPTTLLELEFDDENIIETLCDLSIKNYSHTLFDRDDDRPPLLFVFGKVIKGKMVYIKFKIREGGRKVVCISFHYPEKELEFPYANYE